MIIVYAAAAFVILEAIDIIFPRLEFPDWTVTFVIVLLAIGFPFAIIFSWIFDITPKGIKKPNQLNLLRNKGKIIHYLIKFHGLKIQLLSCLFRI